MSVPAPPEPISAGELTRLAAVKKYDHRVIRNMEGATVLSRPVIERSIAGDEGCTPSLATRDTRAGFTRTLQSAFKKEDTATVLLARALIRGHKIMSRIQKAAA
jgi:hypothetical protein